MVVKVFAWPTPRPAPAGWTTSSTSPGTVWERPRLSRPWWATMRWPRRR